MATCDVATTECLPETASVGMHMGLSATFLFGLWMMAAVVCFFVNWVAAEFMFEAIKVSVVDVFLVLLGVHIVASDAFL